MNKIRMLTNQKFGRLKATHIHGRNNKGQVTWFCECDCGNHKIVNSSDLVTGNTESCGCLRSEASSIRLKTHGMSKNRTYKIWANMRKRCLNKNCAAYKNYGGRGITVAARWDSFENFLSDMGEPPDNFEIERINNDLGYSPENCKWVSPRDQQMNKRDSLVIDINGEKKCLTQWCETYGAPFSRTRKRIVNLGWSPIDALTQPPIQPGHRLTGHHQS